MIFLKRKVKKIEKKVRKYLVDTKNSCKFAPRFERNTLRSSRG